MGGVVLYFDVVWRLGDALLPMLGLALGFGLFVRFGVCDYIWMPYDGFS